MLTNILLVLILGIVITSFIILNNKINIIQDYLGTTIRKLNSINSVVDGINNSNCYLVERFNKRILVDNEHFEIIKNLIDKNKIEIYNNQQILYNLPVRLETFIAEENNAIRKEITKQAKISSKIKSKSKMNNNINKQ